MKIGFFGGSFNPPTKAHFNIAKKVLKEASLDKILFVPMGDSYQKQGLASEVDRLNMLRIMCSSSNAKNLEVSEIELKRKEKMHAIDAFRLIKNTYPEDEKFFIMGADNFIKLSTWNGSEELINNYNYIVIERGDIDLNKYIEQNPILKTCKLQIIKNSEHKTSSATEFREMLADNKNQSIVQDEVYNYIIKNNLYKSI